MEGVPHACAKLLASFARILPTLRERPHWAEDGTLLSRLLRGEAVLKLHLIFPLAQVGTILSPCHQHREEWRRPVPLWGKGEGNNLHPAHSETTHQFITSFCVLGTVHTLIGFLWVQEDFRGDRVPSCE